MAKSNLFKITSFIITLVIILTALNNIESSTKLSAGPWPAVSHESQGIDSEQLAGLFDYVKENDINIHSLVLIRNGFLVLEAYFYPNSRGIVHDIASVTKSITSALIGIAIDKGYIKSLRQPVLDFFPDRRIDNLDEQKKRLTRKQETVILDRGNK